LLNFEMKDRDKVMNRSSKLTYLLGGIAIGALFLALSPARDIVEGWAAAGRASSNKLGIPE